MYDPCIPEALKMFENMTQKHSRELLVSKLNWKFMEDSMGNEQLVPFLDLEFKF